MTIFPQPESKASKAKKAGILRAIQELSLLPEKTHLIEKATNEIFWAAMLAPKKSKKERDNDNRRSVAGAGCEIKDYIEAIENFLGCTSNLSSVAVRSIDRQTTPDIYVDDIGYVYVSNASSCMGALLDKARYALSEFPDLEKPKGRPHKNGAAENVTDVAGRWYEELTGQEVTRINDAYTNVQGSPFSKFLDELFTALDMKDSSDSLTRRSKEKKAKKKSD